VRDITRRGGIRAVFLRHEGLVVRVVQDLRTDIRVAAESRITPQRAITKNRTRRMLETTIDRSERPGRRDPVQAQTYEITFLGQAGTTLSAEFDDCEVTIGPGTTTLRAELPDRGALSGLIERINSLGLDVIDVSLVAPPAGR
jgi:hypothetical protein